MLHSMQNFALRIQNKTNSFLENVVFLVAIFGVLRKEYEMMLLTFRPYNVQIISLEYSANCEIEPLPDYFISSIPSRVSQKKRFRSASIPVC